MDELKDPLTAGPNLVKNVREMPDQIRGPKLVSIY